MLSATNGGSGVAAQPRREKSPGAANGDGTVTAAAADGKDGSTAPGLSLSLSDYVSSLYGDSAHAPCPFTPPELQELEGLDEMLVYVPKKLTAGQLCERFGIRANVNFDNETMIRNAMADEDHWFITSASKTPELMFQSGHSARRTYEDEGLHGMDFRRYLAFAATYRLRHGTLPDHAYWCFLLSGSYDRSGISVLGFDSKGVLNHHGWMKNFKAKFTGSRYVVLAPRIEITPHTKNLPRAYRGRGGGQGREAGMD